MDLFRAKAPTVMRNLMRDFPALQVDDAAAILGNLGHECAGFTRLQEIKPVVKGSRGGYGWAQWTGPRRRAYEAWCKERRLDPAGDEANYGYLVVELRGPEKKAVPATVRAVGLAAKVKAFELAFERAGAKHYDSRTKWAQRALDAWNTKSGGATTGNGTPIVPLDPTGIDNDDDPAPARCEPPAAPDGLWARIFAAIAAILSKLKGQ